MAWEQLDPATRALAEQVLSVKELEAMRLWAAGAGYRRIARILGIAPTTARDRIERGHRKLAEHLDRKEDT